MLLLKTWMEFLTKIIVMNSLDRLLKRKSTAEFKQDPSTISLKIALPYGWGLAPWAPFLCPVIPFLVTIEKRKKLP